LRRYILFSVLWPSHLLFGSDMSFSIRITFLRENSSIRPVTITFSNTSKKRSEKFVSRRMPIEILVLLSRNVFF